MPYLPQDTLWAVAFLKSPATITLKSGNGTQTFTNVAAGVTRLQIPLAPGKLTITGIRSGATIFNQTPSDFTFITNPTICEPRS